MTHPANKHRATPPGPWEALMFASSDGVVLLDRDDCVQQLNPVAARLLGDGLVGAPISGALPPAAFAAGDAAPIQLGSTSFIVRRIPLDEGGALLLLHVERHNSAVAYSAHEQKLYDLLMTISSALDMNTILERVARLTMELVGADASSIPLYDAELDRISTGWIINLPQLSDNKPLARTTNMIWDVIDNQTPILINDYPQAPRALPMLIGAGVSAVMVVPISGIDRAIFGVIVVYRFGPAKGFSKHDLDQLIVIGRQTGIAIQNARLYEDILREANRRHLLYVASVEIGAALDPEALYAAIHRAASRLMTCDSFALALHDQERGEVAYVYIVDQQGRWPARRVSLGRGLLGHIISRDISLRLSNSDPEIESIFGAERLHRGADVTRSLLATVMHSGEQIVGALTVQAFAPDAYTAKDLDALETLASTAAIATQNARLFARIQELATIDSLTQVPNRRHFFDVASREIERTDRYRRPVSLIMFDIDSFKSVNDTYGHLAGDQVLKTVAARCRDDLRDIDTVARFGGEEFIILLPETPYEQALQVAQRLRVRMSEQPVESDAGPISITVSVGVDSCDDVCAGRLSDLIDRADRALYVAKNGGRDRVIGFRSLVFGRDEVDQPSAELKKEPSRS